VKEGTDASFLDGFQVIGAALIRAKEVCLDKYFFGTAARIGSA
jgi:hypothetical protein